MLLRRVTWTAVPAASMGMLAWLPFLYLTLTRGRPRDHVILGATLALSGVEMLAMIGVNGEGDRSAAVGACMIFYAAFATVLAWGSLAPRAAMSWGDGAPVTGGLRTFRRAYDPLIK